MTLTQNSDTPYGLAYGDASGGPVVLDIPQGLAGAGARYLFVSGGRHGTAWAAQADRR